MALVGHALRPVDSPTPSPLNAYKRFENRPEHRAALQSVSDAAVCFATMQADSLRRFLFGERLIPIPGRFPIRRRPREVG